MSNTQHSDSESNKQTESKKKPTVVDLRRDFEFMPATLEVLDRPPAPFSQAMLIFIVVFAAFVIGWSWYAKMDIVVNGMGVVIPKGKVKVVQPLEPGIVKAIHVRDGQMVKAGDLLISMDNTDSSNDISTIDNELSKSELTLLRLKAQLSEDPTLFTPTAHADPQTISLHERLLAHSLIVHAERVATLDLEIRRCTAEREALQSNVTRLTQSLPLSQEIYDKKTTLAERKLIPGAELLQAKIELGDAQHNLQSAKSRLQEVVARLERAKEEKGLAKTEYRRDILDQLSKEKNTWENLRNEQLKATNKHTHFQLKAPADGIVQQLAINTVGGVVTAAQPLLVIVPTDSGLEVEAKILNKDIGFIVEDQEVSVKVTAYPFTRYGDLKGTIEWVARDAVIDKELGPSFPIRVAVSDYTLPNIVNGRQGVLSPGMTVTADIKVGQRRVIQYFLGPLFRYKDKSLREI
ncbi:HlyD family type I secretion periplasmic adaptor subunit [Desulforhopalus sp. 52FAK]